MTLALLQEELSVCLNKGPKEVLVILGLPLTGDPNRGRECPGKRHHGSVAERWQKCD